MRSNRRPHNCNVFAGFRFFFEIAAFTYLFVDLVFYLITPITSLGPDLDFATVFVFYVI